MTVFYYFILFRLVKKVDERSMTGIDELHQKVSASATVDKRKGILKK